MTEPVEGVGAAKAVGKNATKGSVFKREKKRRPLHEEEDSVDISEEARNRASGKKRGGILEYLRNEPDE